MASNYAIPPEYYDGFFFYKESGWGHVKCRLCTGGRFADTNHCGSARHLKNAESYFRWPYPLEEAPADLVQWLTHRQLFNMGWIEGPHVAPPRQQQAAAQPEQEAAQQEQQQAAAQPEQEPPPAPGPPAGPPPQQQQWQQPVQQPPPAPAGQLRQQQPVQQPPPAPGPPAGPPPQQPGQQPPQQPLESLMQLSSPASTPPRTPTSTVTNSMGIVELVDTATQTDDMLDEVGTQTDDITCVRNCGRCRLLQTRVSPSAFQ